RDIDIAWRFGQGDLLLLHHFRVPEDGHERFYVGQLRQSQQQAGGFKGACHGSMRNVDRSSRRGGQRSTVNSCALVSGPSQITLATRRPPTAIPLAIAFGSDQPATCIEPSTVGAIEPSAAPAWYARPAP